MGARNDIKVQTVSGTIFRKLTSSTTTRYRDVLYERRQDITPASLDKVFVVEKRYVKGGIANGENSGAIYKNWPVEGVNSDPFFHLGTPNIPNDNIIATQVAGSTNPSEPLVSVGTSLAELRELPGMLRKGGVDIYNSFNYKSRRQFLRHGSAAAADLNLRFQFLMRPLLGDIDKLLYVQKQIKQRCKDLLRSEKKGGLVKKRDVYDETTSQITAVNKLLVSAYGSANQWRATVETRTRRKIWVVCRWVPDGTRKLPIIKDKRFQQGLGSQLFGVDIFNFKNIWDALPWSWLVDWVVNVGDYMSATNNTVGIRLASVVVCETTVTEQRYTWTDKPAGVSCQDVTRVFITKRRSPTSLDIRPKAAFLNKRQVGILASLVRNRVR